ncbi:MAG: AraC family transcriptional regulator [Cereibacter sphaeroides]|uniref:AraC family transcriptional regulator n=1 Tax=Cereibacter sphaeroides TaxID=1063 RepID=A0A2W5U9T2_CERSP|nr:MAG: AraC family transcriptional regulator [Cereibacter sphaeroides]
MSFRPNMTAFTKGIRATDDLRWRAWDGAVADLWQAEGMLGGEGHYVSPDPRVVIFLDDGAAAVQLWDRPDGEGNLLPARIAFIPAGMPLWSRIVEPRAFRHLDIHFDRDALALRLGERLGSARAIVAMARPAMLDRHHAIETLAALLAAEVSSPEQHDLFVDGLAQAILLALIAPDDASDRDAPQRGGLTPLQMRRLSDLMRDSLHRRLPVSEMADHVSLSESWFARAFKQTVGETPHAWQQRQRISFAQEMLAARETPLAEIAQAAGFADQAHLTRAFRLVTGTTPAVWRRARVA